jgi:hypothetical protein
MIILGTVITSQGLPPWMYFMMRLLEVALLVGMTAWWLNAVSAALNRVHRSVRSSEPNQVWLTLIPGFGLVWAFIMNTNVSESLAREYRRRGWHSDEARPGFETGTITAVLACIYQFQVWFTLTLPFISFLVAVVLGGLMYRHADRLNAFRERLDKEPDAAFVPNQQQPVWPQPYPQQYPPPPPQQWPPVPPQQQWPPVPPQQQWPPAPPQPTWPPQPPPQWPQPPANPYSGYQPPPPDDNSRWMPPENQNNENS